MTPAEERHMIEIRILTIDDDFSDLIALSQDFFHEYETHHADFFKIADLEDEDVTGYFSSFCGHETRLAFIALDGERVVGYITAYVKEQATYWQVRQVGEISGLMVQEAYRRTGIAKKLLQAAKQYFESQGIRYYMVYTAVENHAAIDFYTKNGLAPLYTTFIGEV
jgi:ribosomal protein S18 acetylase RimI-like enzyme